MKYLRLSTAALLVAVGLVAACDSSDPAPRFDPAEVAGTYRFSTFTFAPDAGALPPYDVADTLAAETQLILLNGGQYVLLYGFKGGTIEALVGDFEVREESVRLDGRESDAARYQRILLDDDLVLARTGAGQLRAQMRYRLGVNQQPKAYAGINASLDGTLDVRLTRETTSTALPASVTLPAR